MTNVELYEIWAPSHSEWSQWAKPVLFAQMSPTNPLDRVDADSVDESSWLTDVSLDTAVVIDLPGADSVALALTLAGRGYRPVPLFNGCSGKREVVVTSNIQRRLALGVTDLANLSLQTSAPPAFMLDANRDQGRHGVSPGDFDNRWVVVPQDFPSASFLLSRSLRSVLLVQRVRTKPKDDLAHVMLRWQEAGLRMLCKDPFSTEPAFEMTVNRPPWYRSIFERLAVMAGFRRNAAGGFGSIVPMPSSSGSHFG